MIVSYAVFFFADYNVFNPHGQTPAGCFACKERIYA